MAARTSHTLTKKSHIHLAELRKRIWVWCVCVHHAQIGAMLCASADACFQAASSWLQKNNRTCTFRQRISFPWIASNDGWMFNFTSMSGCWSFSYGAVHFTSCMLFAAIGVHGRTATLFLVQCFPCSSLHQVGSTYIANVLFLFDPAQDRWAAGRIWTRWQPNCVASALAWQRRPVSFR